MPTALANNPKQLEEFEQPLVVAACAPIAAYLMPCMQMDPKLSTTHSTRANTSRYLAFTISASSLGMCAESTPGTMVLL